MSEPLGIGELISIENRLEDSLRYDYPEQWTVDLQDVQKLVDEVNRLWALLDRIGVPSSER